MTLLDRIREVPDSNLSLYNDRSHIAFFVFLLSARRNIGIVPQINPRLLLVFVIQ
jgi:hypothetical protein